MNSNFKALAESQIFTIVQQQITAAPAAKPFAGIKNKLRKSDEIIDHKYRIIGLLGEGGMGAVYKAQQLNLDRLVALKTLRTDSLDHEAWQRFQREAQTIARLTHNNIVQVFDFGVDENNIPFYTMECLEGESLASCLERECYLSINAASQIFIQVCRGLAQAHNQKIVHRDLKPGNIFLAGDSRTKAAKRVAKIVDFGLAGLATHSMDSQKLTTTGTIFGSPLYMSPEQSLGYPADERSDIYSLGCALFETLTGSPPFKGETSFATILQHQNFAVPALQNPADDEPFPQRLSGLVTSMLAKEPSRRPQSCLQVERELQEILQDYQNKSDGSTKYYQSDVDLLDDHVEKKKGGGRTLKLMALVMGIILAAAAVMSAVYYHPDKKSDAENSKNLVAAASTKSIEEERSGQPLYMTKVDAQGNRTFIFPPGKKLGILHWQEPKGLQWDRAASGTVEVSGHSLLTLKATDDLKNEPQLFLGFAATDLDEIDLDSRAKWNNQTIKYMSHLIGLRNLTIDQADLDRDAIADLNKFLNVTTLSVKNTPLNGIDIAQIIYLPRLECFFAANMVNVQPALEKMKYSRAIKQLHLDGCQITDQTLDTVITMPNLTELWLSRNAGITDLGLKKLLVLKKLNNLYIDGVNASPNGCIETLKNMNLKYVSLDSDRWPQAARERLRRALIKCKVFQPPRNNKSIDVNVIVPKSERDRAQNKYLEEWAGYSN